MRRTALIPLLLVAAAALTAARPAPPSKPAPRARTAVPQLEADPAVVLPGDVVTLHGSGFPANVHLALFANAPRAERTRIGGAMTGRSGRFTATVHIRQASHPGVFRALACYDACGVKASARFRIRAAAR
ncbi:MAG TPA: hypothetical protein VFV85_06170 [Conexibacter sp.]|nr:hypothetical protein [Conexibacter sp.]